MKRIVILCTCLLLWIGCSHSFPVIKGDNSIISKERNLPSYSQINLECGADIILTKGQVGNITLKASQNIEPYVITEVTNGVLTIKLSPDFSFQFTRKLELYIPVDESLSKISVSGSGDISSREQLHVKNLTCKVVGSGDIDLSLQADSLSVSIKGSGDMDIKGTTETLDVTIAGSGDFQADELITKKATASICGSGDVELYVTGLLSAIIRGSGDITIKGNPKKVDVQTKGSGSVRYL